MGRNMDVHVLNTYTYRWKAVHTEQDNFIPFQRYGHTAVAYKSNIYIWGGRNDIAACNTLFCFDTITQLWSTPDVFGNVPDARDGHTACCIGHHMYIFSGYLEDMDCYTQDVHCLNFHSMTWSFVKTYGPPPIFRDFHTATGLGEKMYVWGGREVAAGRYDNPDMEEYGADLYVLDTTTNHWSIVTCRGDRSKKPEGRRSHSAFVYQGRIYIFGGFNSKIPMHFNDIWEFDPAQRSWQEIQPLGEGPCPRRRQSCIIVGHRMFLFGGTSPKVNADGSICEPEPENVVDFDGVELFNSDEPLRDHSDLHVLDMEFSLRTLCLLKVQDLKLNTSLLPRELQTMLTYMKTDNTITRNQCQNG